MIANTIEADDLIEIIDNNEGSYLERINIEDDLKEANENDEYDPDTAFDRFQDLMQITAEGIPDSISDREIDKAAKRCRLDFEEEQGI